MSGCSPSSAPLPALSHPLPVPACCGDCAAQVHPHTAPHSPTQPYTALHTHPALPLPLALPQSCPALTALECAEPLERTAARTPRPVEQPGSRRWAHARAMHTGSVCTQTQRCRQHTGHALAHTWAGAGQGLVLAGGWCSPVPARGRWVLSSCRTGPAPSPGGRWELCWERCRPGRATPAGCGGQLCGCLQLSPP